MTPWPLMLIAGPGLSGRFLLRLAPCPVAWSCEHLPGQPLESELDWTERTVDWSPDSVTPF